MDKAIDSSLVDFIDCFHEEYLSDFCSCCKIDIMNKAYSETLYNSNTLSQPQQIRLFLNDIIKYAMVSIVCCKNKENGCNVKIDFINYKEHIKDCKYQNVLCNACNCIYTKSDLESHFCFERTNNL